MSYSTTYCPLCRTIIETIEGYTDPFDHIEDYHSGIQSFSYQVDMYNEKNERIGFDLMILEESGGLGNYPVKLVK